MKFLAVILAFVIVAQPVQAGFCDMGSSGGNHSQMAMSHGGSGTGPDHDCCEGGNPDDNEAADPVCDGMAQCGPCLAGLAAAIAADTPAAVPGCTVQPLNESGGLAPSHASLLFRPPIALS